MLCAQLIKDEGWTLTIIQIYYLSWHFIYTVRDCMSSLCLRGRLHFAIATAVSLPSFSNGCASSSFNGFANLVPGLVISASPPPPSLLLPPPPPPLPFPPLAFAAPSALSALALAAAAAVVGDLPWLKACVAPLVINFSIATISIAPEWSYRAKQRARNSYLIF